MDMSQNFLIKNSAGDFVSFSGVRKTLHDSYISLKISGISRQIKVSKNHRFLVSGREITASDILVGTSLGKDRIVEQCEIHNSLIELFDPVNVGFTSAYYHDENLVSHNCSFIGSANTLISSDVLLGLQKADPLRLFQQVRIYHEPDELKSYVMLVDVSKGRGQDFSTFTIIETSTTPFRQVAVFKDNIISPLIFPDIIVRLAKMYNNALVIIENNDAGQIVCNSVYHEYEYENTFVSSSVKASGIGVTMTKRVKRIGCSNLKDLIESGKLEICDVDSISELSSFEAKGGSYEASGTAHDDLVMNLVLFAWFVSTDIFKDQSNVDLKNLLYSDRLKELEDDVVPFGIISGGNAPTADMSAYEDMITAEKEWSML